MQKRAGAPFKMRSKLFMKMQLLPVIFLTLLVSVAQDRKVISLKDNSDWWSVLSDPGPGFKPGKHPLSEANFRIAGVQLGSDFEHISSKLGPARTVERGDASTGRSQLCYLLRDFAGAGRRAYLIFETGELDTNAFLFDTGPDWNGRQFCAESRLDLSAVQTGTRLKLGLTPAEVRRILGKPDVARSRKLIYYREFKSEISSNRSRDSYDVQMDIEARFVDSKLSYLALSRAESN